MIAYWPLTPPVENLRISLFYAGVTQMSHRESRRDFARTSGDVTVPPTRPDPTRPIFVVTAPIHRLGSNARALRRMDGAEPCQ